MTMRPASCRRCSRRRREATPRLPESGLARTARIVDALPATFTGATWTCSGTGGGACGAAGGSGDIDQPVELPSGGVVTFTVVGNVSASAVTLTNAVTVTAAAGTTDPDT